MSNSDFETLIPATPSASQEDATFAEMLSSFEQQHADDAAGETIAGTVVSVGPETILVDIGRKIEGSLPVSKWKETQQSEPQRGAAIHVSVGPRNEEGYYELSTIKVDRPKDWSGLQAAFDEKRNIAGVVAEQVKGGFRVDIGVRAFMPASRSGVREADEMPNLVGQEIQCRITKLDTEKEDIVVDRRVVLEEEQAKTPPAGVRRTSRRRRRARPCPQLHGFRRVRRSWAEWTGCCMSWTCPTRASARPRDVVKVGDEVDGKDPQDRPRHAKDRRSA